MAVMAQAQAHRLMAHGNTVARRSARGFGGSVNPVLSSASRSAPEGAWSLLLHGESRASTDSEWQPVLTTVDSSSSAVGSSDPSDANALGWRRLISSSCWANSSAK